MTSYLVKAVKRTLTTPPRTCRPSTRRSPKCAGGRARRPKRCTRTLARRCASATPRVARPRRPRRIRPRGGTCRSQHRRRCPEGDRAARRESTRQCGRPAAPAPWESCACPPCQVKSN
eukprot:7385588-Prymnesium_polylepis.2